jgi:hypothetical protein
MCIKINSAINIYTYIYIYIYIALSDVTHADPTDGPIILAPMGQPIRTSFGLGQPKFLALWAGPALG